MADEQVFVPGNGASEVTVTALQRMVDASTGELAYFYSHDAPVIVEPGNPTPEEWEAQLSYGQKISHYMGREDAKFGDILGEPLNLREVFMHPVVVNGENGRVEATRIVLVDDEGVTYAGTAEGSVQGLTVLLQLFGPINRWPRAIPVVLSQVGTRAGRRTYTLEVYKEEKEAAPKRRGR